MLAVNSRPARPLRSTAATPSGAASAHTTVMSVAPRLTSSWQQWMSDPPVASIGSSSSTERPASSSGSEDM